jgi:hypothetical protein
MLERRYGVHQNHTAMFRHWTIDDYESRGMKIDDEFKEIIARRICPDIKANETLYKLRNV